MFFESFKVTGLAIGQIIILGAIGYALVKANILKEENLNFLSRLVVVVTLPALIFCQLIKDFSFDAYPYWWFFPVLSIVITGFGLFIGRIFSLFIKGEQAKIQFMSLIGFQNAGYIPLVLAGAILPEAMVGTMLVYIFLFMLGFNLAVWSLGVYMLTFEKSRKFDMASLFSPPVIATLFSLVFIYLGFAKSVPDVLFRPLKMVGECTVPMAIFVVSANLAYVKLKNISIKNMSLVIVAKLIVLPLAGMLLVLKLGMPQLIGTLIIMQLAMPPATSLSVIIRHYKKKDLLISHGIFFGHMVSLLATPIFLSLYFVLSR